MHKEGLWGAGKHSLFLRTWEGLSLLLKVNPVTWNRRGQALDAGTPSLGLWRAPAP